MDYRCNPLNVACIASILGFTARVLDAMPYDVFEYLEADIGYFFGNNCRDGDFCCSAGKIQYKIFGFFRENT